MGRGPPYLGLDVLTCGGTLGWGDGSKRRCPGNRRFAVLGACIASRLSADGWAVAVNYRAGQAAADRVVEAIRESGGVAHAFGADVLDEAEVTSLVGQVERHRTGGGSRRERNRFPARGTSRGAHLAGSPRPAGVLRQSPTLLVQAALPGMRMNGGGRVILIGSDMTERALPQMSAYVAAKSAQVGLTKVLAKELGPDNITVNLVQPGWIPVERHAGTDTWAYAAEVPLPRLGHPRMLRRWSPSSLPRTQASSPSADHRQRRPHHLILEPSTNLVVRSRKRAVPDGGGPYGRLQLLRNAVGRLKSRVEEPQTSARHTRDVKLAPRAIQVLHSQPVRRRGPTR